MKICFFKSFYNRLYIVAMVPNYGPRKFLKSRYGPSFKRVGPPWSMVYALNRRNLIGVLSCEKVYQENIAIHVTVGKNQRAQENKILSTEFYGLSRKKF